MSPDAPQLQQKLSAFASRASALAPKCDSEATTKSYLIVPYLDEILAYNPHNPDHCVPEYSADIKGAGDKVDYALLHDGQPIIIVEAKSIGTIQTNHATPGQLNGYFVGCDARFAALTDGLIWNWYRAKSDHFELEESPFLSHDVRSPSPVEIHWLRNIVNQPDFDIDRAHGQAGFVKMKNAIQTWLRHTRKNPSDKFLTFLIEDTQSEKIDFELVRPIFVNAFASLDGQEEIVLPPLDPVSSTVRLEDGTELHYSESQRAWRLAGETLRIETSPTELYRAVLRYLATLDPNGPEHFYDTVTLPSGRRMFLTKDEAEQVDQQRNYRLYSPLPNTDRWIAIGCGTKDFRRRIQHVCQHIATVTQQPYEFGKDLQVWLPNYDGK